MKIEIEKKNKEIADKINDVLTLALLKKKFVKADIYSGTIQDELLIQVGYKNNSDKDIIAVRSILNVYDIFSEKVKTYRFEHQEVIKANSTSDGVHAFAVNMFDNDSIKVAHTDLSKIKAEFIVRDIVFADKTKLSLEATSE